MKMLCSKNEVNLSLMKAVVSEYLGQISGHLLAEQTETIWRLILNTEFRSRTFITLLKTDLDFPFFFFINLHSSFNTSIVHCGEIA